MSCCPSWGVSRVLHWSRTLIGLGCLMVVWGCGDPNVPLTRPPENAFRVSSPRPRRIDRPNTRSRPSPQPRSGPAIAQITAEFLGIPWSPSATSVSLLRPTAEFLQIPLPPPLPSPSPEADSGSPLPNLGDGPVNREQLEQLIEQAEGEITEEQQQQIQQMLQNQDPEQIQQIIQDRDPDLQQLSPGAPDQESP